MKNEYKITKELMKSWAKEYHLHGTAKKVSFIIMCYVAISGVGGVIVSIVRQLSWPNKLLFTMLFVFALYELLISRFVVMNKRYKTYSTTYGVSEWTRTTEFLDEEIVVTDHTSIYKYKYENIQKIKEKNNCVLFFMNNNLMLRIYKDSFINCDWVKCKEFLISKKVQF